MDMNLEQPLINHEEIKILKRKANLEIDNGCNKVIKSSFKTNVHTIIKNDVSEEKQLKSVENAKQNEEVKASGALNKTACSPKKRLELPTTSALQKSSKQKFIYGNYSQYYGYRNKDKDNYDIRLDVFAKHKDIFKDKHILDIGCNSGFITMEVAKQFDIKSIVGIDIDRSLVNQANKHLIKAKKSLPMDNESKRLHKFPYNVSFVHGNYVLKDDVLLEIEKNEFDVILCLSITKWIHLNFGDKGVKQAFKRMFLQLKPQGKLILEAQLYDNYGRRKKITDTIYNNFKNITFYPKDFTEYLLSSEVGFSKVELMGVPDHSTKGFKRPIQIFFKT